MALRRMLACGLVVPLFALPVFGQNETPQQQLERHDRALTNLNNRVGRGERAVTGLETAATESKTAVKDLNTKNTQAMEGIADQEDRLKHVENNTTNNTVHLDRFWLLLAAVLVFFMQAGFKCLEVGMVRRQHGSSTAMKNLLDWMVLSAVYFLWGFGVMYGSSSGGFFGTDLFAPTVDAMATANPKFGLEFFLFQLAFAGTAATIVSGAMAERTGLLPYILLSLFVGGIVYPLIGHWAWGTDFHTNTAIGEATGWLKKLGFLDFAGSTVVHSVGAWVSLIGIWMVGPRLRRFNRDGSVNHQPFAPYSLAYSVLGVFILWFGWWGFNGGSQLRYDLNVSSIVLNTNVAAAFGGLTAFLLGCVFDRKQSYEKLIGGTLGGLVAVTACCNVISSSAAIAVGILAGVIHNLAYDALLRLRLDDPVGAIPVHGACGVLGTLCVAVFGDLNKLAEVRGLPIEQITRLGQAGLQGLGIIVVMASVALLAIPFIWILDQVVGLRVMAEDEEHGFTIGKTAAKGAQVPLPSNPGQ
jgi:Amt family ammonium transporter